MFFFLIRSVFFELSRRYFCTLLHTSANVPSTATSSRHKGRKRHENCFKDMLTALNQRLVSRFSFLFLFLIWSSFCKRPSLLRYVHQHIAIFGSSNSASFAIVQREKTVTSCGIFQRSTFRQESVTSDKFRSD